MHINRLSGRIDHSYCAHGSTATARKACRERRAAEAIERDLTHRAYLTIESDFNVRPLPVFGEHDPRWRSYWDAGTLCRDLDLVEGTDEYEATFVKAFFELLEGN